MNIIKPNSVSGHKCRGLSGFHPARDRSPSAAKIAFFGHDAAESTVIKRSKAFAEAGADVTAVMFERPRDGASRRVSGARIPLGRTRDRAYLARLPRLLIAALIIVRQRRRLAAHTVFYARNIDMLLLAAFARWLSGAKAALVYEVLDIQRVFLKSGLKGQTFRWAERRLMAGIDLLVVSSPEFVRRYFNPVQHYFGEVFVLENKISPAADQSRSQRAIQKPRPSGPPWVIGWFGTLRCRRSLKLLCEVAGRLPDHVRIEIRGRPSLEDLRPTEIAAACDAYPNVTYFGPYESPDDLAAIYSRVHFAWAFDGLDRGGNSDWLLPNRMYEGGAFGAVALSSRRIFAGRVIAERGLGIVVDEPVGPALMDVLAGLDNDTYQRLAARVSDTDPAQFFDFDDTRRLVTRAQTLACGQRGARTDEATAAQR